MMDNLHRVGTQNQKLSIEELWELVRSEDDVEEKMKGLTEKLRVVIHFDSVCTCFVSPLTSFRGSYSETLVITKRLKAKGNFYSSTSVILEKGNGNIIFMP
jgi:hypothetical protein